MDTDGILGSLQQIGEIMQIGDLVRDITGLIGLVILVDVDFVETTFGWVKKENLEVLCKSET